MQPEKTVEELYQELGLTPPESIKHLTEEELREKLKIEAHHSWKQQGTMLFCNCEIGHHTTNIPPTHILTGTDEQGMPILREVKL